MQCSVNDTECVPGRLRRGMCERHYRRMKASGSTGNPRIDNLRHFTVAESGCWLWSGAIWPNGYGKTSTPIHGTRLAHRAVYIEHRGPIPDGLDLDHVDTRGCHSRACVNPDHLEPVSRSVNITRGYVTRGVCRNGLHDLTTEGSTKPGTRRCLACWRATYRAAGIRYRGKPAAR